jgi:hypothetical protein
MRDAALDLLTKRAAESSAKNPVSVPENQADIDKANVSALAGETPPKTGKKGRTDVKRILSDPDQKRELMISTIMATQAREGIETTREQAAAAYDKIQAEKAGKKAPEKSPEAPESTPAKAVASEPAKAPAKAPSGSQTIRGLLEAGDREGAAKLAKDQSDSPAGAKGRTRGKEYGVGDFLDGADGKPSNTLVVGVDKDGGLEVVRPKGSAPSETPKGRAYSAEAKPQSKADELGFYSQAERTLSDAKTPSKQRGSAWDAFLRNPQRGITKEEFHWTGLGDFLKKNADSTLTREQVAEYLKQNKVEIIEVGNPNTARSGPINLIAEEIGNGMTSVRQDTSSGASTEILVKESGQGYVFKHPKSGDTYRFDNLEDAVGAAKLALESRIKESPKRQSTRHSTHTESGAQSNYREIRLTVPKSREGKNTFANPLHYKEPGVVVSFRVNDRKMTVSTPDRIQEWTDAGYLTGKEGTPAREQQLAELRKIEGRKAGGKTLFVEEIQSDAGSRAHKVGVRDQSGPEMAVEQVPNAPFIAETKKYTDLAVKRLLRIAAEEGYDSVAWTTGDQQSRRWSLVQHADRMKYDAKARRLEAYKGDELVLGRTDIAPEKLVDYVGNELAARLLEQPDANWKVTRNEGTNHLRVVSESGVEAFPRRFYHSEADAKAHAESLNTTKVISGDDLKVGSRWAYDYYDRVVPGAFERVGKKFGVKLGQSEFEFIKGSSIDEGSQGWFINRPDGHKATSVDLGTEATVETLHRLVQLGEPWDANEPVYFNRKADAVAAAKKVDAAWAEDQNQEVGPVKLQSVSLTPEIRERISNEGFAQYSIEGDFQNQGVKGPKSADKELLKLTTAGQKTDVGPELDYSGPGQDKLTSPDPRTKRPFAEDYLDVEDAKKHQPISRGEKYAAEGLDYERIPADWAPPTAGEVRKNLPAGLAENLVKVGDGIYETETPRGTVRINMVPSFSIDLEALEAGRTGAKAEYLRGELSVPGEKTTIGGKAVINAVKSGVLPHEVEHVWFDHFADPKQREFLVKKFQSLSEGLKQDVRETIADAYSAYHKRMLANPSWQPKTPVGKFIKNIYDFFHGAYRSYRPSVESTFEGIRTGKEFAKAPLERSDTGMVAPRKWSPGRVAESPSAKKSKYIVTPDQARGIDMKTTMPKDEKFVEAVKNTPGASLSDDGLSLKLLRFQKPEQAGEQSVRTGVFYLPSNKASQAKAYRTTPAMVKAGGGNYGGTEKISGETVVRNPLVVNGTTGGQVPEAAFEQVAGKGAVKKLWDDTLEISDSYSFSRKKTPDLAKLQSEMSALMGKSNRLGFPENKKFDQERRQLQAAIDYELQGMKRTAVADLLEKYGADPGLANEIIYNSKHGNQLGYAIRENIIAHAVRKAGYDSVLGHYRGKFTELFDVREEAYPVQGEEAMLHSDFEGAFPKKGLLEKAFTSKKSVETENTVATAGAVAPKSYSAETVDATMADVRKYNEKNKVFPEEAVNRYEAALKSVAAKVHGAMDRLGYVAIKGMTALKENSDKRYGKSLDFTTLCRRRYVLSDTVDAIQKAFADRTGTVKILEAEDIIKIRSKLEEQGHEVNCGPCYVESRRINIATAVNKAKDGFVDARKKSKTFGQTLRIDPKYHELLADQAGRDKLFEQHPDQYAILSKAFAGTQIKIPVGRASYTGEILSLTKAQVEKFNKYSGLRSQSWSDFEVPHLLDKMQAVYDMAARGLKGHSYTKEINYVETMRHTGEAINMSLIPAGTGFNKSGKLVFNEKESVRDLKRARQIRAENENVGFEAIGISDKHVEALLADPNIDYVIPYHASGLSLEYQHVGKMKGWDDYTDSAHWRDAKTGEAVGVDREIFVDEWKGDLKKLAALSKKRGVVPPFQQFKGLKGYEKLLVDRRIWGAKGKFIEQKPVEFKFDMNKVHKMLDEYQGDHGKRTAVQSVVDEFSPKSGPLELKQFISRGTVEIATASGPKKMRAYDSGVKGIAITRDPVGGGFALTHEATGMAFGVTAAPRYEGELLKLAKDIHDLFGDSITEKDFHTKATTAQKVKMGDLLWEFRRNTKGAPKRRPIAPRAIDARAAKQEALAKKEKKSFDPRTGDESRDLARKDPVGYVLESSTNYILDNMMRSAYETEIGKHFGGRLPINEEVRGAYVQGPHGGFWAGARTPKWVGGEGAIRVSRSGTLIRTADRMTETLEARANLLRLAAAGNAEAIDSLYEPYKHQLKQTIAHESLHGFADTIDSSQMMQDKMDASADSMLAHKMPNGRTLNEELDQYFGAKSMEQHFRDEIKVRAAEALERLDRRGPRSWELPEKDFHQEAVGKPKFTEEELVKNAGRTAITRGASTHARALTSIVKGKSVIEWGQGKGADVKYYKGKATNVQGYDPAHQPVKPKGKAQVVTNTFIGNVLGPKMRHAMWKEAFDHATEKMHVAVRSESGMVGEPIYDGILMGPEPIDGSLGVRTFQRFYKKGELVAELQRLFPGHTVEAGPRTVVDVNGKPVLNKKGKPLKLGNHVMTAVVIRRKK